jgi:glutaminyl-peptide cyclotransferase
MSRPGDFRHFVVAACFALVVLFMFMSSRFPAPADEPGQIERAHAEKAAPAQADQGTAIDAQRAFKYLKRVCDIGPRISGTTGMAEQQKLISEHFVKLKAQVKFQTFDARHPQTGTPVRMSNMLVSWHPESKERVLLGCHYDTRPLPDRDPNPKLARQGQFLGANDGASGVALFLELGHHMAKLNPKNGVDFVFFDGEELVYNEVLDPFFLGSTHFAKEYRDHPPEHRYVQAVVIDMIGDKNLQIFQEGNSLKYAPELTKSIWQTARRLGVKEFVAKPKHEVRDDHLPLNEIAKIPACDIIDFDYPHWHTTRDLPANCSGASLAKVARVLLAWLEE